MDNFAVYFRANNVISVRYAHLSEQVADDEVDRINSGLAESGIPSYVACAWSEQHHPDAVFVIG